MSDVLRLQLSGARQRLSRRLLCLIFFRSTLAPQTSVDSRVSSQVTSRLHEGGFQRFHNEHHVHVLRDPKLQALRGEPFVARHAADEHERFPIVREMLAEKALESLRKPLD